MDLHYLLNILLKRKWLLLSVILISTVATYFFIGKLPDTYKAESVIETGIINYKGATLSRDNPFIQKYQIESAFSGLIEKMKSRNIIKILTDELLAHDLLADGLTEKPFRTPDEDDLNLSQNELQDMVMKLKTNLNDSSLNSKPEPFKPDQRLAEAYRYDYESLMKKLEINRIGETDYLKIGFESENPELSFFVVNTFLTKFMEQHEEDLSSEEMQKLTFNKNKLFQYKKELDSVVNKINLYKTANGLVDVSTQRETIIAQKRELELKLQETEQTIASLQRSLSFVETEIFNYNKVTTDEAYKQVTYNDEYTTLTRQITQLQDELVQNRVDGKNVDAMERRLENLKEKLKRSMEKSQAATPKSEKDKIDDKLKELVRRRLDIKLDLDLALEARPSYASAIANLTRRAEKLLIDDNYLYNITQEKNRLDLEYDKIRKEYEETVYYAEGTESPLAIIERVEMPVEPESKNRAVFSVFAGVAGGSLMSIVLFLVAFMDSSIATPGQFGRITGLPLVGYVNEVKLKNMDLQQLFANTQTQPELEYFKENIRKIRTAVENSKAKTFLFVSPKEQEGKSFLIVLLAYALSLNDRKVLIIDTNFKNNTLSAFKTKSFIELTTTGTKPFGSFLGVGPKTLSDGSMEDRSDPYLKNIDIVGNKGGSQSPSEVLAGKDFKKIMDTYKQKYDFIFMEGASMNKYSDARELLPFTEKLAVVFSAESPIGSADKDTLEYLKGMNGKMFGGILNKVDLKNI